MRIAIIVACSGALLLSGCASTGGSSGAAGQGGSGGAGQNAAGGALIGAVAGCALASVMGKDCGDGALLGAAIGAAIGWSSYSEKVASAQTVNAQARREGLSVPSNDIRLKAYEVRVSQGTALAGGAPVQVIGDITLNGQSARIPDVAQSMTLFKANGERASDTPQIAKVERIDGAGQYKAVGVYKIPRGMPQGQYSVQSVLFIDGKEVARRDTSFRVAAGAPPRLAQAGGWTGR